jgi:type IV secretion system protein VirD4
MNVGLRSVVHSFFFHSTPSQEKRNTMRSIISKIAEFPYRLSRAILILSVLVVGFGIAMFASLYGSTVAMMAIACLLAVTFKKVRSRLSAFGTAAWSTEDDVRRAKMLDGRPGLIIGRIAAGRRVPLSAGIRALLSPARSSVVACRLFLGSLSPRLGGPPPIVKLSNAVHTAVFAPTGVGKGVSCVIPFLRDCPDSCVVVDFKGELAKLTGEYRRRKFGHRIVLLDPFRMVTESPDAFNPLDFIDKDSRTALDECRDLAQSQVIRTGQEKEPHWADAAEMWISAMTAVVVQYADRDDRSLQTMRGLLTEPAKIEAAIKLLCGSDAWGGMLGRLGFQLTHFKDKELGSTLTTTNRFLRYLDTPAVADSTEKSSFDPAELLGGKLTVYLILPPEHARAQSALLRMWIGGLLRAVVRGGLQEKTKVHFVLDEAASLGRLEQINDAVDKYRGYGVRLMFLYQSLGQLKECFPEGQDQTLLSNVSQIFFGVNDPQTADYVSQRLGEETIVVGSGGSSWGISNQRGDNRQKSFTRSQNGNDAWQQHARKLLKPEEVMALDNRTAITFTPGVPPICTKLVRYYEQRSPFITGLREAAGTLLLSAVVFVTACTIAIVLPHRQPHSEPPAAVSVPQFPVKER